MLFIVSLMLIGAAHGQTQSCSKMCTEQYQPVCGTDHHTYGNMCFLQIAECKAKLSHHYLTLSHSGSCSGTSGGSTHPVSTLNVNCDLICDDEDGESDVCATDGKTYENHCAYDNARCLALKKGIHLSVRHTGACTDKDVFCPLSCDQNDLSPVCSARNTTYRNSCFLEQLHCKYSKIPTLAASFELAHEGSCDGSDPKVTHKVDCSAYMSHAAIAVEGHHGSSLFSSCPRIHEPVCGSDLRTHSNVCYYCHSMSTQHKISPDNTVPVIVDKACPSYLAYHSHIPVSNFHGDPIVSALG